MTPNHEQIVEIPLANIHLDPETQIRVMVNEETIRRYADAMETKERCDKFPPIILFCDIDGSLWLADGHHRVMAASRRNYRTIRAIIRNGTKADAIWEAVKVNGRNGLSLSRADIRRAVEMVIKNFPDKSTRVIADLVGVSGMTVFRYRESLYRDTNAMPDRVVGKNGKSYPARLQRKRRPVEQAEDLPEDRNIRTLGTVESQIMATLAELKMLIREWFGIIAEQI